MEGLRKEAGLHCVQWVVYEHPTDRVIDRLLHFTEKREVLRIQNFTASMHRDIFSVVRQCVRIFHLARYLGKSPALQFLKTKRFEALNCVTSSGAYENLNINLCQVK